MKITIPYRRGRTVQSICYALSSAFLLAVTIVLLRIGTAASLGCAAASLFLFLFPCWTTVQAVWRAAAKTGCFSITSDGLENVSHPFSVGCFSFPLTIRLIPWSCIDSFRIDRSAGGERLLLMAKDIAEFPKGYSPLMRMLLEREQNRGVCGFSIDSRFADASPQELFRLLQQELESFRRRDYPSGWPEAVPPIAPESSEKSDSSGSDS